MTEENDMGQRTHCYIFVLTDAQDVEPQRESIRRICSKNNWEIVSWRESGGLADFLEACQPGDRMLLADVSMLDGKPLVVTASLCTFKSEDAEALSVDLAALSRFLGRQKKALKDRAGSCHG